MLKLLLLEFERTALRDSQVKICTQYSDREEEEVNIYAFGFAFEELKTLLYSNRITQLIYGNIGND